LGDWILHSRKGREGKGREGKGIPAGCSSPAKTWPRAAALALSSPLGKKGREREGVERRKKRTQMTPSRKAVYSFFIDKIQFKQILIKFSSEWYSYSNSNIKK